MLKFYLKYLFPILYSFSFAQDIEIQKKEIDSLLSLANATGDSIQGKAIEISERAYLKSKEINYSEGILKSRMFASRNSYDLGKFKETLILAAELEKEAKKSNKPEYISEAHRLKAMAYTELGFFNESEAEIKKGLFISNEINDVDLREFRRGFLYETKAFNLDRNNKSLDSVIMYHHLALKSFHKIDGSSGTRNFGLSLTYSNLGLYYVLNGNSQMGEDYLVKSLELSQNGSSHVKSFAFLELGNLYKKQKEYPKAITYYEKGISLSQKLNQPYTLKKFYHSISEAYSGQGNLTASLEFLQKYTALNDSLLRIEKNSMEAPARVLLSEKDAEHSIFRKQIYIFIFITLTALLSMICYLIYQNRSNRKKYNLLIEKLKKPNEHELAFQEPVKESSSILASTEQEILQKLEQFEKSKKLLKREVSLSYLAAELQTNTKYLSEIIKKHKGRKNFNHYLNGLRIDYITKKIYEDKVYCDYKISYLAEVSGFSTRELFARIFKEETGVSPSFFINEARKNHQNR